MKSMIMASMAHHHFTYKHKDSMQPDTLYSSLLLQASDDDYPTDALLHHDGMDRFHLLDVNFAPESLFEAATEDRSLQETWKGLEAALIGTPGFVSSRDVLGDSSAVSDCSPVSSDGPADGAIEGVTPPSNGSVQSRKEIPVISPLNGA